MMGPESGPRFFLKVALYVASGVTIRRARALRRRSFFGRIDVLAVANVFASALKGPSRFTEMNLLPTLPNVTVAVNVSQFAIQKLASLWAGK